MDKSGYKKILPHLVAPVIFLVILLVYFSPVLEGKAIQQSDTMQFRGMSKEIMDFRAKTGQEPLWTNSMFGGMPAYLISTVYRANLFRYVNEVIALHLPNPVRYAFMMMIGFYLLLIVGFKTNPWLAIVGAIAFGFSSYFFIIQAAGHNSKAHSIAFIAPVLAGIILAFRGKWLLGSILTGIFLALQLYANHMQITYYTLLMVILLGIFILVDTIRKHALGNFFKPMTFLFVAVLLAVGSNLSSMWLTYQYGKVSIRGKSELTLDKQNQTAGLDKDYILEDYSYNIPETMDLLIPNFMGGASSGFDTSSKTYEMMRRNNVPNARQIVEQLPLAYWGPQRFTSGPVYIGAVVIFLFVFGLFVVKGKEKWWIVSVVVLAITLAWGKHFLFLSDLFIRYVPGYNKFRTVSMILVMAELAIPLLGFIAVQNLIEGKIEPGDVKKALRNSLYILGGITLFFTLFPGLLFNFSAPVDNQLTSAGWPAQFLDAIREDRQGLLQKDAFRSLIFVVLTAGLLAAFIYKKINMGWFVALLGLIVLLDMWPVDKRYLSNDHFAPKKEVTNPFQPTTADLQILKDTTLDYRVLNLTVSPFMDASTSYFHKSIGGYHGAKMRRYQDLITYQISKNNMQVLNMLNTRYFIVNQNGQPTAQFNPRALGNAWFVKQYKLVPDADQEMEALNAFDPTTEAVVNEQFADQLIDVHPGADSLATIRMLSYAPNHLVYESSGTAQGLAVFSEIYYNKGWNATIDGNPADYLRADYVLRAMVIPPGTHTIEFTFHPKGYYTGEKISLASSGLLLFLFIAGLFLSFRKENEDTEHLS